MDKEIRILILEDSPADVELQEHQLRKAGLVFTSKVVDTREAFLKELDEFFPDLILSDYDLPTFNDLEALRIAKEKCPDVPVILVTGRLGEEFAIEKLKEGATDYVLKSNLKRLVPSVNRALVEAKMIKERRQAEEFLRESEEKYKILTENSLTGIFIHQDGRFVFVNDKFTEMHGYEPEELLGKEHLTLIHPDERATLRELALKDWKENLFPSGMKFGESVKMERLFGLKCWQPVSNIRECPLLWGMSLTSPSLNGWKC
ncbi:MAG: PAS domain S-box protein [Nitrospira sp.]|nr:PAS domain S-box protein [Nitrospira sp.]